MNIGYALNYCSKLLRHALNKELQKENLTISQFAVLKDIDMNTGGNKNVDGIIAVEIAERLDMDKPTISAIVQRLTEKDYLERLPNPKDKRSYLLNLTNTARKKIPHLEEINQAVLSTATEQLSEKEINRFEATLNHMIENLR